MQSSRSITGILAAVLLMAVIPAHSGNLPTLKTKIRSLAAFKNGIGFVLRTGKADLSDGWTLTEPIPPAALGSLWIGTPGPNPVVEVRSFRDKETLPYDAVDMVELLAANVGKEVSVTWNDKVIRGKILSVPKPRVPDAFGAFPNDGRPIYGDGPGVVLIETAGENGKSIVSIARSQIQKLEMPPDAKLTTSIERTIDRAKLRVAKSPKSADISIGYLTKGITWSPSYLVDISDPKNAVITLDAILASDSEDLENTDVSFVVGYPNFLYSNTITPLSLQQEVNRFVSELGRFSFDSDGSDRKQVFSNYALYAGAAVMERVGNETSPEAMMGESNEDLYFYTQKNVTLKKGDRTRFTVFTGKSPYEHVYQWDVADNMSVDDRGIRRSDTTREEAASVWHSLKLTNKTGNPWTTAPAFTISGDMPVAQDTLRYTPNGAEALLKLTISGDVRAEAVQVESARKQITVLRQDFDDVTVDGNLLVKNNKAESVKLVVTKSLVGEVISAGQGGKVEKVAKKIAAVNPTSQIKWELTLEAGKQLELSYQYHILVVR